LVEPTVGKNRIRIGVIVEDISEVLNIASYNMDNRSKAQSSINIDFILKIGRERDVIALAKAIEESLNANHVKLKNCIQFRA